MKFDLFGREITIGRKPTPGEIAYTKLQDRWSMYPSKGLTPESLASRLLEADRGNVRAQAELFEEMEEKDAHLYSQMQTRKNAVSGLDYDILPFSDSAEDKKIADFCGDLIFNLENFEDAVFDLLDAIGKGYALSEIIWGTDAGKAAITDLRWVHAKRAVFYDLSAGDLTAKSYEMPKITTAAEPYKGEEMPPFKIVYHRYKGRSGYDTRAGILRVCAWMYLFKNYAIKDWMAFLEVYGMPLRVGKYPAGASAVEKTALFNAVKAIGTDASAIISEATNIEFVEAVKSAGTNNFFQALGEFCNKEMSKAILGQTATSEGTPGKLGNEDAQDRVRHDLIKADAEALAKTIRGQIFRPLVGYNFGWDKPLPWFKMHYEAPEDLKMLSEVYKNVWNMGQPISQEHVADRFKIPLPAQGETPLSPPSPGPSLPFPLKENAGAIVTGRLEAAGEASMESQRMRFVNQYLAAVKRGISGLRTAALKEIEDFLLKSAARSEAEFTKGVAAILSKYYSGVSLEEVERAVTPIYSFYRLTDKSAWTGPEAAVGISFDMVDRGTIDALVKVDRYYLSRWIDNQDMQGPVMKFLQEKYLEGGESLFGRGSVESIAAFREQFADRLNGLEDWQIRRIVDTSVTRMRTLGDVRQAVLANAKLRVHVTRGEMACEICKPHHGEIVNAGKLETKMLAAAKDPEVFGVFNDAPPYHPNCVCRLLMDVE